MTRIEKAALKLATFLKENSVPDEVVGAQEDEWPVQIRTDNTQSAEELSSILNELESSLIDAGHMPKPPKYKSSKS